MSVRNDSPGRDAPPADMAIRVAKLERINAVLMDRVERSTDVQGNAFSLFQTTIALERQVRERTEELTRTLRKLERANDELKRAKEVAEFADRSKTRFIAAAGHDLLQPVNAARLSVSALSEVQAGEEGGKLVRQVERALSTIETLLKTLLDISKLDSGIVVPERSPVPLADMISGLASDFAPIVERKGLTLRMPHTSAWVDSDPIMLRRILQNLISNALRYTQRGGVLVGIRARGERQVRIDIVDTGPGIPPESLELIFEEFYRGKATTRDDEVRLGLGLSIVRRLVGALGHDIQVRSAVGRGTTFSLTLDRTGPQEPVALEAFIPRAVQGYGFTGALVAVVENDPVVREATASLIERWCCDVVSARSVGELTTLALARRRKPDVILADYHLDDGETGLQAVRALRAKFRTNIPALVVTADQNAAVVEECREAGIEIVRKPVKPAELRALMAHLLGGVHARG